MKPKFLRPGLYIHTGPRGHVHPNLRFVRPVVTAGGGTGYLFMHRMRPGGEEFRWVLSAAAVRSSVRPQHSPREVIHA